MLGLIQKLFNTAASSSPDNGASVSGSQTLTGIETFASGTRASNPYRPTQAPVVSHRAFVSLELPVEVINTDIVPRTTAFRRKQGSSGLVALAITLASPPATNQINGPAEEDTQEPSSLGRLRGEGNECDEDIWSISYASPRWPTTPSTRTSSPSSASSTSTRSSGRICKPHGHSHRQGRIWPSKQVAPLTALPRPTGSFIQAPSLVVYGTSKEHGHPDPEGVAEFYDGRFGWVQEIGPLG